MDTLFVQEQPDGAEKSLLCPKTTLAIITIRKRCVTCCSVPSVCYSLLTHNLSSFGRTPSLVDLTVGVALQQAISFGMLLFRGPLANNTSFPGPNLEARRIVLGERYSQKAQL
jgi:hypothetical protein